MNKYRFRKYDKKYPELFRQEQIILRKIIGKSPGIEHVGSTAVPGLGGKGVLDVMISVNRKEINKIKKQLEKANYVFKESGGEKERLFFKRNYKYCGKTRMVHIQLTHNNSNIEKRMLKFKAWLINDKQYAKKYEDVKRNAVKLAKGEGKIYRKYKDKIFNKIK